MTGKGDHRLFFDHEDGEEHGKKGKKGHHEEEGPLAKVHELFANLLIALVSLHISYLLLFKWPLVRFMLFLRPPGRRADASGSW